MTMKVCIIVHSKTGNTLKLAEITAEILRMRGCEVELVHLQTASPVIGIQPGKRFDFQIINQPSVEDADVILAGGPVWAFSIAPVVQQCIRLIPTLKGKLFVPFATMAFPFKWLGGNGAVTKLAEEALAKDAKVRSGIVAQGHGKNRDQNLQEAAEQLSQRVLTE